MPVKYRDLKVKENTVNSPSTKVVTIKNIIESLTLKHKYLFENCEILCNMWNKQYKLFLFEYDKKKITGNLSPLTLLVRIPLRRGVFNTPLCDKVCQCLVTGYSGFLHQ